jgi:alkanesulfonate monooxygenase SsuD/methylene tetrahydromethanopterin reductase-like flavin-dependent oxidoreductase (luciferase family)
MEREIARSWMSPLVAGSPSTVAAGLEELVARTRADELMVTTMVHGHADRLRSYELVADAWSLSPSGATPG